MKLFSYTVIDEDNKDLETNRYLIKVIKKILPDNKKSYRFVLNSPFKFHGHYYTPESMELEEGLVRKYYYVFFYNNKLSFGTGAFPVPKSV